MASRSTRSTSKPAPYSIASGVVLRWSENKPGIEIEAIESAKSGSKDVRVTYYNFGGQPQTMAFRVVITPD